MRTIGATPRNLEAVAGDPARQFAIVAAFAIALGACAHRPVPPTEPRPVPRDATIAPEAAPPAGAPTDARAPIEVLVENRRPLGFEMRPRDPILVACTTDACLAVWVDSNAVLTTALHAAAPQPRVAIAASGSRLVRVAGLVPHPRGFAFLRFVSRSFESAELEVCLVDRDGAPLGRIPLGPMHGNSSEPALAIEGDRGLVGLPATATRVDFVELDDDIAGARRSAPGDHTTTPRLAHDGSRFLASWLEWGDEGPTTRFDPDLLRRPIPYFGRASLACGGGRCLLAGDRGGAVAAVSVADAAVTELAIASGGYTSGEVHRHADGFLVVARSDERTRLVVVGDETTDAIDLEGRFPALSWRGGDRFLGYTVEAPSDHEPMTSPCPDDESATCSIPPPYYRMSVADIRIALGRP